MRGWGRFRFTRASAWPSFGISSRRVTCPLCWRTSPRCCGSGEVPGLSGTPGARPPPSTVYHSLCPGARSSPHPSRAASPKCPPGETVWRGPRSWFPGYGPPAQTAQFQCSRCSIAGDHADLFLVIINTRRHARPDAGAHRACARRDGRYPAGLALR